jgi:hypothetical protein
MTTRQGSNCHADLEGGLIALPLKIDVRLPSKVDEPSATAAQYTLIRGSSIGRAFGC